MAHDTGISRGDDKGVLAYGLVDKAVERLGAVLDQETAALRNHVAVDLSEFNDRKSQGLLDLNRALRLFEGGPVDQATLTRLSDLRVKLESNTSVLRLHLEAVREISDVMANAIRDAESDGTYSASILRRDYES
jgi:hypothetical protein